MRQPNLIRYRRRDTMSNQYSAEPVAVVAPASMAESWITTGKNGHFLAFPLESTVGKNIVSKLTTAFIARLIQRHIPGSEPESDLAQAAIGMCSKHASVLSQLKLPFNPAAIVGRGASCYLKLKMDLLSALDGHQPRSRFCRAAMLPAPRHARRPCGNASSFYSVYPVSICINETLHISALVPHFFQPNFLLRDHSRLG
ncbi:hypothetical protein GM658_16545 [Pseudoduganella eburnea]|uniref:Uncharacterized protein n=1 Tax=Massilia eburnea TaxID=1776165 RepID=A0A6L6QKN3_9BURK|nr:hypothetical protein [Massilia eburnea]MTW12216.1 hypothetical protein [Massilia eburnea]